MTELIGHITNVVLPIALCVLTGYGLAVLKLPFDRKLIGTLVQNVGYPALVISHLSAGHVVLSSFLVMAGAALAALAVFIVVSAIFLKFVGLPLRAFIAPLSLNNVGNIGLPVAALAFGDAGLSYSFAFLIVVLLGIFTYGTWVPRGSVSARDILTSPVIYALAIALLLLGLDMHLPKPLASAVGILGGLAIPLMLLTLGHTLATLELSSIGRGTLLAGFHLLMAAATGFGLATLFVFSGTERGIFILMCLMPVSVATYLFVELYTPEHAPDAASLILVSTLLTVLVLPVVLTYGL
jgi:predicted permease